MRVTLYPTFFFFNDTATTEIYTLSLHDALPILPTPTRRAAGLMCRRRMLSCPSWRSEEHRSELQSRENLVCRLLLEKKKIEKWGWSAHRGGDGGRSCSGAA